MESALKGNNLLHTPFQKGLDVHVGKWEHTKSMSTLAENLPSATTLKMNLPFSFTPLLWLVHRYPNCLFVQNTNRHPLPESKSATFSQLLIRNNSGPDKYNLSYFFLERFIIRMTPTMKTLVLDTHIRKTSLIKYTENFNHQNMKIFR